MRVRWFLLAAAILLPGADLPKGDAAKPGAPATGEKVKPAPKEPCYARMEILGLFHEPRETRDHPLLPKLLVAFGASPQDRVEYPIDLSGLKDWATKDKWHELHGRMVRVTGTLLEMEFKPRFREQKSFYDLDKFMVTVVKTLEISEDQGDVIHVP